MNQAAKDIKCLHKHVKSGDLRELGKLPALRQLAVLLMILQRRGYHCQPCVVNVSVKSTTPSLHQSTLNVQAIDVSSKTDFSQESVVVGALYDMFSSMEEVIDNAVSGHIRDLGIRMSAPLVDVQSRWHAADIDTKKGPLLDNARDYWVPRALVLLQALDLESSTPSVSSAPRPRL